MNSNRNGLPRRTCVTDKVRRVWWAVLIAAGLLIVIGEARVPAQPPPGQPPPDKLVSPREQEPITPLPDPPAADPHVLQLGQALFRDTRLSSDGKLSCISCHDVGTNGADDGRRTVIRSGPEAHLNTPTIFNAALNFRLNWEGNFRTLEAQAEASIVNDYIMGARIDTVIERLHSDADTVRRFRAAYGHGPDKDSLLNAIATYERSLLTPDSRFDQWLRGADAALTPMEKSGYELFKSLGCVSCHQGVNVGGNLYERHGIFHPLASPQPEIVRVPSLRNVATTGPYFHDGSAPTLDDAVRRMAAAQLDQQLSDDQIGPIVAFLRTLTGKYQAVPVKAPGP